MTPQTSELVQLDLDSIRRSVTGPVIGPDDADYDAATDGHARRHRRAVPR